MASKLLTKIIGSSRAASTTIGHVAETSTLTAGRDKSSSNDPQVCATSGSSARRSMAAARLLKLSAEQKLTSGMSKIKSSWNGKAKI
mmetsp:Transcript_13257/g.31419  ORF Transcript_13257/g.31419 Transcript_13257/m.31419 type:complete len:87 (-) Transcript_13257:196-456(-)